MLLHAVGEGTSEQSHYQYLQDELGSPIRLLTGDGTGQEVYGYDEFGMETVESNSSRGFMQPFTYTGYQRDNVANTYFAQAREYSEKQSRFISSDEYKGEIAHPSSLHSYMYCINNPIRFVDPSGYYTVADGKEAHILLQTAFMLTHAPYAFVEFSVTGNPNTVTGGGFADMVLFRHDSSVKPNNVEVYEIKPISQRYTGKGNIQRQGYITALKESGYYVNENGTTFNPNYWVIPRIEKPNEYVAYYTYPEQPGMIYYGHIKTPDQEHYVYERKRATNQQEDENKDSIFDIDPETVAGVAVVTAVMLWAIFEVMHIGSTGAPSGRPCPTG